jgi:hypothetical protein
MTPRLVRDMCRWLHGCAMCRTATTVLLWPRMGKRALSTSPLIARGV